MMPSCIDSIAPDIYLRKVVRADRAELIAAARRSARLHRPWLSSPPVNDARFDALLANHRKPHWVQSLVCRRETHEAVGVIHVMDITRGLTSGGGDSARLGYYGFVPLLGRGLMTQGLRLVLHHCFHTLNLHRVEALIDPANTRSIALARRVGMRCEGTARKILKVRGTWRDHQRWAMLEEEW
jgi:ribosomal-protein-alanine N-acetyltransferase